MTYTDWANRHCSIFGLLKNEELMMVLSWEDVFAVLLITPTELTDATNFMATNPPKYRTEHLTLIQERIISERERKRGIEERKRLDDLAKEHDNGECVLCFNSGFVSVPHVNSVKDFEWVYPFYSCVVACSCWKGRDVHQRSEFHANEYNAKNTSKPHIPKRNAMMTISQYEQLNGDWKLQLAHWKKSREVNRVAADRAGTLDKQLGEIIRKAKQGVA